MRACVCESPNAESWCTSSSYVNCAAASICQPLQEGAYNYTNMYMYMQLCCVYFTGGKLSQTYTNFFPVQAKLYEMLALLRGHVGGESPFYKLVNEDMEAIDALTSKSKRRKRTKQKQQQ